MPSVIALFASYFVIGAFLNFCDATFLVFFIIGFGAMLFYVEDFEEWSFLTTGIYLTFAFVEILKTNFIPAIGLFAAGIVVTAFSHFKRQKNEVSYQDPISVVSCFASGTSVALGLVLALIQLDVWGDLENKIQSYSYTPLLKMATGALIAALISFLSTASSICVYKSGRFIKNIEYIKSYKSDFVKNKFLPSIIVIFIVWSSLLFGYIFQNIFSIFSIK